MISRALNIQKLLENGLSVLLLGPRGTGKTSLIKSILPKLGPSLHIDLLSGGEFQRFLNAPQLLGAEVKARLQTVTDLLVVAIDEIQKLPALLDEVHRLIETHKGQVVFVLSGSSARKLRRGGANLLAGRAISNFLHPLHESELDIALVKALRLGTLPAIYFAPEDLAVPMLESYVSTYLREEIQQEALVRAIDRFGRFLEFAGQVNGEPVNFAKLAKQIGVAGKTVAEYYSILVDTLIVMQMPGWSESVKKQLLQAPKFYFFDCGVLNAINGYLRVELKEASFLYGRLFETFILSQIHAANDYEALGLRFFYWREKSGKEIDLIIARNVTTPLVAVEIKSSANPSPPDCPGFAAFAEDYPNVARVCICRTPRSYSDGGILFVPWQEAIKNLASLLATAERDEANRQI